jgi:hypothetical protein
VTYALQFSAEEDRRNFRIGSSDFRTAKSFCWAIEGAHLLASGGGGNAAPLKLLKMAAREVVSGANNMPKTPEKLQRQGRKLDKLNIKVCTVLAAMKGGEALLMEYRWYGRSWHLSRGRSVPDEVAQIVIKSMNVADVGDALQIDGARPQTWRWVPTARTEGGGAPIKF